jgi:DNA-binding transcriptional ArsR family regulator
MPPSSSALINAVSHPTRRRILQTLVADSDRWVSADEIATMLDQPLSRVSYHLKALARCEVLRLSPRDDRGGAPQPYGWSLDVEADWMRVVLDVWVESRPAH